MGIIAIASDHAGYAIKEKLVELLQDMEYSILDFGCFSEDSVDYPDYAAKVVEAVLQDANYGVLICGTGIGMAMKANKYRGIRAAVCHDEYTAEMCRRHNDANIVSIGARVVDETLAKRILAVYLSTEFEGGRHQSRVDKLG